MVSDPLPTSHRSATRTRSATRSRTRSTQPTQKWCPRCRARTRHLFDHGEEQFTCSECDL